MIRKSRPSHHWLAVLLCVAGSLSQAGCDTQRATGPEEGKAVPGARREWLPIVGGGLEYGEDSVTYDVDDEQPWTYIWCATGTEYSGGWTYDGLFESGGLEGYPELANALSDLFGGLQTHESVSVAVIPTLPFVVRLLPGTC